MGFDWKAFGAAFLDKQTEGIRKRRTDAEEYEEEQEELARENKKLIANRTLLAADAAQMAQKARELGATKEQVMAAMGSGALGIKTFYEKLLAAANQKGMQTLGAADVEAIIDMPEVFEVNPAFVDMSLNEMAQIQYGAASRPQLDAQGNLIPETEDVQTSDSILASMFGVSAMGQAKKKLQDTKYIGGMSIADVNELAAQSDYDSLFPNLGVNFFDKEFYGPASAGSFIKTLTDIEMDAVSGKAAEDFISAAGNAHLRKTREGTDEYDAEYAARNEGVTPMDKEQDAREYLIQTQARSIIQTTIDNFGQTGLFDHQPSVDLIEKIMGEQFVKDQLELLKSFNGVDEDDTQLTNRELTQEGEELFAAKERIREADKQFKPQEDPETQTSDTETQETTVSTEEDDDEFVPIPRPESKGTIKDALDAGGVKAWDRKYEGKLDPITGEKIMVDPRPAAGGPKDKEVEAVTRTGVRLPNKIRKVTAREEWDILYGETHNPDGSPKL